jgi:hypothetical protein
MYQLSEQQIDYIFDDISARGVEMESLQQNLLDHICCIIEQDLEANGDFENFYQKTIQTFYKDALWEIEEETLLLLTYKNYYTMKKIMINSGIAAAIFFIIGSFFKFMHWPGASVLILAGMFIGAFVYLPLLFLFKKNETTESRAKVVLAIGTINGILFCVQTLFKVMHWPGANTMWFVTLGLFTLVFIPLYFFNGIKNPANKINTITTTLILIILAGVFFLQTSLRPSISIEKVSIKQNKHLADCYKYATNQNILIYNSLLSDSTSDKTKLTELKEKSDALCKQIEDLKIKIFQATEMTTEAKINYDEIYRPDNYDMPTHITFEDGPMPMPKLTTISLNDNLNKFNDYIRSKFNQNSASLIDLSDKQLAEEEVSMTWSMRNFYHVPLTCVLRNLNQLQIEIRLIESNCMR